MTQQLEAKRTIYLAMIQRGFLAAADAFKRVNHEEHDAYTLVLLMRAWNFSAA